MIKSLIFNIVGYLFLFGPAFQGAKVQVLAVVFLAIFFVLAATVTPVRVRANTLISGIIFLTLSLFTALFFQPGSPDGLLLALKFCAYLMATGGLILLFRALVPTGTNERFMKSLFVWIFIDSLIPLVMFLSPTLRQTLYPILDIQILDRGVWTGALEGIRFTNLSLGGGTLSIIYSLGILIGYFLYKRGHLSGGSYFLASIFLTIGTILTGRIGLMFLLVFFVFVASLKVMSLTHTFATVVVQNSRFILYINKKSAITFALISSSLSLLIIYILTRQSDTISYFVNDVFPFAFEFFVRGIETGQFGTESLDALLTRHFSVNELTVPALFLGTGIKPNTDVGYINFLYIFGLLGSAVIAFLFIQSLRKAYLFRHSLTGQILFIYLALILIINVKQFFFVNASAGLLIAMIMLGLLSGQKQIPRHSPKLSSSNLLQESAEAVS